MNKYSFSKKTEEFILKSYCEKGLSQSNTARLASKHFGINVSQNAVSFVLKKYDKLVREKNDYSKKPSYRTESEDVITGKIRDYVVERFHALGTGFMSHGPIKKDVKEKYRVDLHFRMFENILRKGGVDLNSDEYRYGKKAAPEILDSGLNV